MNVEEIEMMVKSGNIAEADARLKEIVDKTPNDVKAKLLYGMCRQMLGDEETFCKIHDEMESRIEEEKDEKTLSVWRRYRALWLSLAVGALLLGGAVAYFGKAVQDMADVVATVPSLYGGSPMERRQKEDAATVDAGKDFVGATDDASKKTYKTEADIQPKENRRKKSVVPSSRRGHDDIRHGFDGESRSRLIREEIDRHMKEIREFHENRKPGERFDHERMRRIHEDHHRRMREIHEGRRFSDK